MTKPPKLHQFNGKEPTKAGQASYRHWVRELKHKLRTYTEEAVMAAIPMSLSGAPLQVFHSLGEDADVHDVLEILELHYG